jgi:hypothetical protein
LRRTSGAIDQRHLKEQRLLSAPTVRRSSTVRPGRIVRIVRQEPPVVRDRAAPEDSPAGLGLTVHLDSIVPLTPIAAGSRRGNAMKTAAARIARGSAIVRVRRRSPRPLAIVVLPLAKGLVADIVHHPGAR